METTKQLTVNIQGRPETITLSVNRCQHQGGVTYIVAAVCETGFDLCNIHYGYLKNRIPANPRLRSGKSIDKEMAEVVSNYETTICELAPRIIVRDLTVTYKLRPDEMQCIAGNWMGTPNFKSSRSGLGISWYYHPVYNLDKEITCTIKRNDKGYLEVFADETELYDYAALQELAASDSYKNRKFAFFFYNEVERLLGRPVQGHPEAMSGFFG